MVEAFKYIGMVTGLFILLLAGVIIVTFFAWVVKLEFEWFFGLDITKKFKVWSDNYKVKLAKKIVCDFIKNTNSLSLTKEQVISMIEEVAE